MKRLVHSVRCSGTYHEVWCDDQGRLHKTCNGEGCTLGFESARALLSGKTDVPAGPSHYRDRYSAEGWGERWQNAKRHAWQARAARKRRRDIALGGRWLLEDEQSSSGKESILLRTHMACVRDLLAADYKRSQTVCYQPKYEAYISLRLAKRVPTYLWGRIDVRATSTKLGARREYRDTSITYNASLYEALRLRTALGGTSLFFDGDKALFAGGIIQQRDDCLVVAAGRQLCGLAIHCVPAVVRREGPKAVLVEWLSWQDLDLSTIRRCAGFHPACPQAELLWMDMTRGHIEYAAKRKDYASNTAFELSSAHARLVRAATTLAALPDESALRQEYDKRIISAKGYVAAYGGVVGCERCCSLFEDKLNMAPDVFVNSRYVRNRCLNCEILPPLIEAVESIQRRRGLTFIVKEEQNSVARMRRYLKRQGFRLIFGENGHEDQLAEIP